VLELRYAKNKETEGGPGDQRSLPGFAREKLEGPQSEDIGVPKTKGREI
jgi:hypothetical protein